MALMNWSSALAVGVNIIDTQHQELVKLANELSDAAAQGKGNNVLGDVFGRLIKYTASHFKTEEELMAKHGYPESPDHMAHHADLLKSVLALQTQFKSGKQVVSTPIIHFVRDWLIEHIMQTDKAFAGFLNAKGVK